MIFAAPHPQPTTPDAATSAPGQAGSPSPAHLLTSSPAHPSGASPSTPRRLDTSTPSIGLSEADAALFNAHLASAGDLQQIAQRVNRHAHEVLAALLTEPLASYIAAARAMDDEALRRRALARLVHLMESAPNLTQQRLAATTVLRATDRRSAVADPSHRPRGPSRPAASPRSPRVVGANDPDRITAERATDRATDHAAYRSCSSSVAYPRAVGANDPTPPAADRAAEPCHRERGSTASTVATSPPRVVGADNPDPPTASTAPPRTPAPAPLSTVPAAAGPLSTVAHAPLPAQPASPSPCHPVPLSPCHSSSAPSPTPQCPPPPSPHPPTAARTPSPLDVPETAVAAILSALRTNDAPEPDSGIATAHAFTAADDSGRPVPWSRFAPDFRRRLAPALVGHKVARTAPVSRTPAPPAGPLVPSYFTRHLPAPPLERSVIRADVEHADGRRATALFHLARHVPPGGHGYWLTRAIEPVDSGQPPDRTRAPPT